jgi:hypothetical protein
LGQHADYLFGWKDGVLQKAMDSCTNVSGAGCTALKTQSIAAANKCAKATSVNEGFDGCECPMAAVYISDICDIFSGISALPGGVQIA